MAKLEVLNWDKKKVGDVEMPDALFEKGVQPGLLHAMVRWQLVSRRQGTHATKTKGLVSGGGKKPFKQKGTGNARQGSSRSPLMPGGGTMFGPQPKDYSYSLPRSMKKTGLKAALTYLYSEKKLFIVEDMTSADGKTNELANRLKKFGLEKALLVSGENNDMFERAAKNLAKFRYNTADGVNVYDLLRYDALVMSKDAVSAVVKRCGVE
ncbi:MAG: 50S ribosomal protein L4 [Bdellovibrionaceae bacterium]|nr:50S ribosomal protein L4 [Pseudobdellovibrionaceae bacterium]